MEIYIVVERNHYDNEESYNRAVVSTHDEALQYMEAHPVNENFSTYSVEYWRNGIRQYSVEYLRNGIRQY